MEYKALPSGPEKKQLKSGDEAEVSIMENVYWKELGLLVFVWIAFLALQIAKVKAPKIYLFLYHASNISNFIHISFFSYQNHTSNCSTSYWILNLLQVGHSSMSSPSFSLRGLDSSNSLSVFLSMLRSLCLWGLPCTRRLVFTQGKE